MGIADCFILKLSHLYCISWHHHLEMKQMGKIKQTEIIKPEVQTEMEALVSILAYPLFRKKIGHIFK